MLLVNQGTLYQVGNSDLYRANVIFPATIFYNE